MFQSHFHGCITTKAIIILKDLFLNSLPVSFLCIFLFHLIIWRGMWRAAIKYILKHCHAWPRLCKKRNESLAAHLPQQLGPAEKDRMDLLLQNDIFIVFCRIHYQSRRCVIKWLWHHYPGGCLKKCPIQSTCLQDNGIEQSKSVFASFPQLLEFSQAMYVCLVIACLGLTDIPESPKVAPGKCR